MGKCQNSGNSIKATARCLFELKNSVFLRPLTFDAWALWIGSSNAARHIFMAMATQGEKHASNPDEIDDQDFHGFFNMAKSATNATNRFFDAEEFACYVAARVTAETLYEVANGQTHLAGSTFVTWLSPSTHELTTRDWLHAYHFVNERSGHTNEAQRKITPYDMAKACNIDDVQDVMGVFQYMEALGSDMCQRNHVWRWIFGHPDPKDHELDACEWKTLVPALRSPKGASGFSLLSAVIWTYKKSISVGQFSEALAERVMHTL